MHHITFVKTISYLVMFLGGLECLYNSFIALQKQFFTYPKHQCYKKILLNTIWEHDTRIPPIIALLKAVTSLHDTDPMYLKHSTFSLNHEYFLYLGYIHSSSYLRILSTRLKTNPINTALLLLTLISLPFTALSILRVDCRFLPTYTMWSVNNVSPVVPHSVYIL